MATTVPEFLDDIGENIYVVAKKDLGIDAKYVIGKATNDMNEGIRVWSVETVVDQGPQGLFHIAKPLDLKQTMPGPTKVVDKVTGGLPGLPGDPVAKAKSELDSVLRKFEADMKRLLP